MSTNKYAFISFDESRAIKGLLIFLIVLGHNAVFTRALSGSFHFIYTFHVQAFFILPFFYVYTKQSRFIDSFKKYFARLYYPFILFFIILSLIFCITDGYNLDYNKVLNLENSNIEAIWFYILTLFTGNYYLIDYFTGFQYLWFLPVMFSMSVLKEAFQNNKVVNIFLLIIGFVCYILFFVFMYKKPYNENCNYLLMLFSPFALLQGCGAYFLGKVTYYLINNKYIKVVNAVCTILFILFCASYITSLIVKGSITYCELWTYRFIMPILFINFIYYFKSNISRYSFLKKLGDYSFPMYIIHPPLCATAYLICKNYFQINLVYAIVVQFVVLFISFYISTKWVKIDSLRKRTLPRAINEIL